MISFTTKKVGGHVPLGEKLKKTREASDISIEKLSTDLQIKQEYLESLEKGEYLKLPGEVFVKNFLKAYADYFQLSWKNILVQYEEEKQVFSNAEKKRVVEKSFVEVAHRKKSVTISKVIKYLIIIVIVAAVVAYLGWEINNITEPPELLISEPASDIILEERTIEIIGITTPESQVTINNQQISVDELGNFSELVSLQPGLNTIEVISQKGISRKTKITREILVNN